MNRIIVCLCALALLAAGEPSPEPRLLGYTGLDAQGRPQGLVVALPRARFDELWRRAHPGTVAAAPPIELALGTPRCVLALSGEQVEGRWELPVAVPGPAWRTVELPLPGELRSLTLRPLGEGAPAPRRFSSEVADGRLRLNLEGGQQALLVLEFALRPTVTPSGRRVALGLAPGLGGRLHLRAPPPWRAAWDDVVLPTAACDLPLTGGTVAVGWDLPTEAAPVAGRLAAEQRIVLRLAEGCIEWQAELELANAGVPLAAIRLDLPPGLALTEVRGAGVAGWHGEEGGVRVAFADATPQRTLTLSGVIARPAAAGSAEIVLGLPGATVSRGRLALAAGQGTRFLRPEHPALASTEPQAGEALALRWNDPPLGLRVAWEAAADELSVARDVAVVVGEGRVRAVAALALRGRGALGELRLALPAPWRLAPGAERGAISGTGEGRQLVLSAAAPWADGAQFAVQLEADRAAFIATPALPLLPPVGPGLSAGRLRLAVADAGATRARLDAADARPLAPETLAQELARSAGLVLAAGERWRAAAEPSGAARPTLALADDATQVTATLSHYLILGRDGVRWSAHLVATPEQGVLSALDLGLPPGARLVTVSGRGLGRWTLDGGTLRLVWAAPTATATAVDLELDLPAAADGAVRVAAPRLPGVRGVQQVALVEEDDLGLVRREADGLAELTAPIAPLPAGVDAKQVRWLWKSARSDWSLALSREPLVATAGADGLATLVDGIVSLAPDGEVRGSAQWHVVNRTRQQLPVLLPAGVELWEARVDGQAVRVRRDASGGLWLPVPTLRPGQASTRIALVWRSAPSGGRVRFLPPVLGELKIIASVWRLRAPPGWRLARRDGALREGDPVDAAADRAQAVIDEIQRLQAVDGLNEAGLRRLEGQLAALDSELKDHLASLDGRARALHGAQAASSAFISKASRTQSAITGNRQTIGDIQKQVGGLFGSRSGRRQKLSLDNRNQNWVEAQAEVQTPAAPRRALAEPQRLVPAGWPWDEALAPTAAVGLGQGQAPPGLASGGGVALSGIDLAAGGAGAELVLRGQGAAIDAELELVPAQRALLPWLWLAFAVLFGGVAAWWVRRRD